MALSSSRELAENKLILLYLIDKINMPVSNLQITKIILENKFMNYFVLQENLNELCCDKLISAAIEDGKTYYSITPKGTQFLNYFPNLINAGIKSNIDSAISTIKKNIKNETSISASYEQSGENDYTVSCRVNEDNYLLMEIKITTGSEEDAATICENWEKYTQDIYTDIVDILTKERSLKENS